MTTLWFIYCDGEPYLYRFLSGPQYAPGFTQHQQAKETLDSLMKDDRRHKHEWLLRKVDMLPEGLIDTGASADPKYIAEQQEFDSQPWSVRTANCLANARIQTLEELSLWTARDLLELSNFGPKSLAEVRKILALHGMKLKG